MADDNVMIIGGVYPNWRGGQDIEIRIYSTEPWVSAAGTLMQAGSPFADAGEASRDAYVAIDCEVDLQAHSFAYDDALVTSSTDATSGAQVRLIAYIVNKVTGAPIERFSVFGKRGFSVPPLPASTHWALLGGAEIAVPATPSAPVATVINSGRVDVAISSVSGASSYKLLRSAGGGAFASIATGLNSGTYQDTTVSPLTSYAYRVIAVNLAGDSITSPSSNTVTTPQVAIPDTPVITSATGAGADVHLTVSATARVTSYQVSRKTGSGGSYAQIDNISASTGAALDYHDTTVADGLTYYYKVKATNAGGTSGFSNEVSVDVVVTLIDPLTTSPALWIDGENGSHVEGDSAGSITDQSSNSNNITVNGANAIYHKSGGTLNNHGYYANTTPNGQFTFGTRLTTVRQVVLVFRHRGARVYTDTGLGLLADAGSSTMLTPGPSDHHRNVELFDRPALPFSLTMSSQIVNASATVRVNGGRALPLIPQSSDSWSTGGTWYDSSLKTMPMEKPADFLILSIKTAGNISLDTIMNTFGTPATGFDGDLAACGVWTSALSAGNESGIVAFLKNRYGLTTSPEQHIYIGDSLTYGAGTVGNNGVDNVPSLTEVYCRANGLQSGGINLGYGSAPLLEAAATNQGLYYMYSNYWKNLRDPSRAKQIIILWIGQNDIPQDGGRTGAQIYTNVQAFCNEAHADGFLVLVVSTAPSQFGNGAVYDLTNYATQRAAFNSAMDADHSFADAWLNYSSDTQIGTDDAPINHPENFADGIHLNAAGMQLFADLLGPVLVTLSSGVTPSLPADPSGLTALAVSSSQINLSWADNSSNELSFVIERCAGASCTGFTQVDSVAAGVTTYSDLGLNGSTLYRYRVRAHNGAGYSDYSNTAEDTTQVASFTDPSGLVGVRLWAEAHTEAFANNDLVGVWTDKSGTLHDLAQTDANKKPAFKTGILNSKAGILFDNSAGSTTFGDNMSSACGAFTTGRTVMFVLKPDALVNANLGGFSDVTDTAVIMLRSDGNIWLRNKLGTTQFGGGSLYASGTAYVMTAVWNKSGLCTLYINGAQAITYNSGAATWGTDFNLSEEGFFFSGHIMEVVVTASALSSTDRHNLEVYEGAKYGITIS